MQKFRARQAVLVELLKVKVAEIQQAALMNFMLCFKIMKISKIPF